MRAKIVATLGPATDSPNVLKKLVDNGLKVARLNFSHGNYSEHLKRIKAVRKLAKENNRPIAILADLSGPKIRIGKLDSDFVELKKNQELTLSAKGASGNKNTIPINFPDLYKDLSKGRRILLSDGLIELQVLSVSPDGIRTKVVNGGKLSSHQGVNLPGVKLSLPTLTKKDLADLDFLLSLADGVDWIALSFVRQASDISKLKNLISKHGKQVPIVAKIEKSEAIDNLDEIITVADGIMVARGDLGVEVSPEEVPILQKSIIKQAQQAGKPVVIATQMLDSMIRNPRPTRAEASDVANAVLDGADALMLSGETAVGSYPVESLITMSQIINKAEEALNWQVMLEERQHWSTASVTDAISYATCQLSFILKAKAIITSTQSGQTACRVSRYRPKAQIVAISPDQQVINRLSLFWGVESVLVPASKNIDDMLDMTVRYAKKYGFVSTGDQVVITAGVLVNRPGTTNLIKVHTV